MKKVALLCLGLAFGAANDVERGKRHLAPDLSELINRV